jgi:NAD(P)-dependent dehydrogenase (short-subunit alcohol dehydrogenase family)
MSDYLKKLFGLEDKVVILTGGAGFLGKQYTRALLEAGARVVWFENKTDDEILSAAKEFDTEYVTKQKLVFVSVDITHEERVQSAVKAVIDNAGRIDVLINNAAMNPAIGDPNSAKQSVAYPEYPIELFRSELEVGVIGMQIMLKYVTPHMMARKSGVVVNVGSELTHIAYDWTDVYEEGKYKSIGYIVAKHAVHGLTQGWAAFLGKYGIRVNTFSPGGMQTKNMPPEFVQKYSKKNMLNSMAQFEDYNAHMLFLCSDASRRMTGHNLVADAGKSAW